MLSVAKNFLRLESAPLNQASVFVSDGSRNIQIAEKGGFFSLVVLLVQPWRDFNGMEILKMHDLRFWANAVNVKKTLIC